MIFLYDEPVTFIACRTARSLRPSHQVGFGSVEAGNVGIVRPHLPYPPGIRTYVRTARVKLKTQGMELFLEVFQQDVQSITALVYLCLTRHGAEDDTRVRREGRDYNGAVRSQAANKDQHAH